MSETALWPLRDTEPLVLEGHEGLVNDLAFTPDGRWLLSASGGGSLRAWPLSPDAATSLGCLLQAGMVSSPGSPSTRTVDASRSPERTAACSSSRSREGRRGS